MPAHHRALHSREFIALIACIMLLTALGIDIMLPTFATIREHFGLPEASTQTAQIVTFFFMGQLGQFVFGPLSDRYGRIVILRSGFALYIIGGLMAVFAPVFSYILAARFIAGIGAAALMVSAIACVRDRFAGNQMARTMSLVLTIFLIIPVVAPVTGVFILAASNWQVVFLTPVVAAVVVFLWSLRLPESLPIHKRQALQLPVLWQSARTIMNNRAFVRYTAVTTILFGAFSSYVGSSERIIGKLYGQPSLFMWIFGCIGLAMALFTLVNSFLVKRFGARTTLRRLLISYLILASALLGTTLLYDGKPGIFVLFALIGLLQSINVAIEPNSSALALEPLGEQAGMAAAIYGTSYLVLGAIVGSLIDHLLADSIQPLAIAYFLGGLLATSIAFVRTPNNATVS